MDKFVKIEARILVFSFQLCLRVPKKCIFMIKIQIRAILLWYVRWNNSNSSLDHRTYDETILNEEQNIHT